MTGQVREFSKLTEDQGVLMRTIERLAVSRAVLPQLAGAMPAICILAAVAFFTAAAAPSSLPPLRPHPGLQSF